MLKDQVSYSVRFWNTRLQIDNTLLCYSSYAVSEVAVVKIEKMHYDYFISCFRGIFRKGTTKEKS